MDCKNCINYKSGAGAKPCLKCDKYADIMKASVNRRTIKIDVLPQTLMEAIPDSKPYKDMLYALKHIPVDLALIIAGHCLAGISQVDIARLMHIDQGTISRKVTQAIALLKINIPKQIPLDTP